MSLRPTRDDLRPAGSPGGVSLWYIATRAGVSHRSQGWILNYVRLLVKNEGFPAPLPTFRLVTGERVPGIVPASRWLRGAVDAWFDGYLPPIAANPAFDSRLAQRHADALDQRAAELAA
jgi:hypothetical protein